MKQNLSLINKAEEVLLEIFPDGTLSGKRILVALSGGADSVSLLLVLCILSQKHGFGVLACHVNHMIRGAEADRDEAFAKSLCEKLGVPFYCLKKDVPALSKERKTGLEETARDVRYEYFASFIKDGKADFVATAHTASDNAETVLLNLTRGCGISGLCGIPLIRENIIRPLLYVTREEIEDFLTEKEQSFVTDSTNLCDDYSRNLIRHKAIPALSQINPSFTRCVTNMSTIAKRENVFLENLAKSHFTDEISALSKLDNIIVSRIISQMYKDKCGSSLEMKHTDMLCEKIKEYAESGSGEKLTFNLPDKVSAEFSDGKLRMTETKKRKEEEPCSYDITAHLGINELPCGNLIAVMEKISDCNVKTIRKLEYNKNIYSLFMEARLFSDIIKGKIHIRSAREGERFRLSGMSKAVRKIYGAKKIRNPERSTLPRIYDSETGEILFLPYVGICDSQYEFSENADISITLYKLNTEEQVADQ